MQVNAVEIKLGVRLNCGDYQGVSAEITLKADLDPREGEGGAFDALRRRAVEMLASACQSAHPNAIRASMNGAPQLVAPQPAATPAPENAANAAATEEKAKRTRRTQAQIAADAAAQASADRAKLAETQLGETAPAGYPEPEEDDFSQLLGDDIPEHPKMTQAEAKAIASALISATGGPSLMKLLSSFGAKTFSELNEGQYGAFAAKAKALIAGAG